MHIIIITIPLLLMAGNDIIQYLPIQYQWPASQLTLCQPASQPAIPTAKPASQPASQ